MTPHAQRGLSRRRFLATTSSLAMGAVAVAACGGSSSGGGGPSAGNTFVVVTRFPNTNLVPGNVRLPISLADTQGVLLTDSLASLPATLSAQVVRDDSGEVVVADMSATKHGVNLPQPYWPFFADINDPGIYRLIVEGGPKDGATFQVFDPGQVSIPLVGSPLPPFDTPTTDDPGELDPLCTYSTGTCPFHTMTLSDALNSGKPVAYLIGTPAYCKTGTCTPALDTLIELQNTFGDNIEFVHAEVYTDRTATTVAPAVRAYYMDFEPSLFIADSDGVLRHRLDAIFDQDEVQEALSKIS
jgi:hypothetical protein